jgi:subtilisin family serine protease
MVQTRTDGARIPVRWILPLLCLPILGAPALALDDARKESGVDRLVAESGLSGKGVLVAIIDRGLDYTHPAFRTVVGGTRIEAILDLTDDAGAEDEGNPHGFGTIYERGQIETSLATGRRLKIDDAEGRGTCNVGIACGNGAGSPEGRYRGIAPEAAILFVKIKLDRGREEEPEDGDVEFFELRRLRVALEFCVARAKALAMPCVVLMNFGQVGGPTDGQSRLCRSIDAACGPGIPGMVVVSGPGDNGDRKIRAGGVVPQGGSLTLGVEKESEGEVIADIWYPATDRFHVRIQTPAGSHGPFAPPKTGDSQTGTGFQYYHLASTRNLNLVKDGKRQIRVDLIGPPGTYAIHLIGTQVTSGRVDAFLGPTPENPLEEPFDHFTTHVQPGSLWDGASAKHVICPGCYVGRTAWRNIQGRGFELMGEGARGALWLGSGTGPTADGRPGITLCAPGDRIIAPYARSSEWAERVSNLISDDGGLYGISSGTTCAAALVTGVVALMLQRDPTLDAAQVKRILQETARRDEAVGAVPNPLWGYGKLDASAALARVGTPKQGARKKPLPRGR